MTKNEVQHALVVLSEGLNNPSARTNESLIRLCSEVQKELLSIADNIASDDHKSEYANNLPEFGMSDSEYRGDMFDLIEWELEAARDSAINGDSNDDRQRHICDALHVVYELNEKAEYTQPQRDPKLPF